MGCGGPKDKSTEAPSTTPTKTALVTVKELDPLSSPCQITEQNLTCFTGADSITTVLMVSPFYPNPYGLLGAKQNEYEIARDKKVKEIIALSSRIVDVVASLKPGIDSLS